MNDAAGFNNTIKSNKNCIEFPSFMSEQHLRTRCKTCMHIKESFFFHIFPKPETRFWHQQGHQRPDALTGSINISQNTNITVNALEHQKAVNTKLVTWSTDNLVVRSFQIVNTSLHAGELDWKIPNRKKSCIG